MFNEVSLPDKQNPGNVYYDKRTRSLLSYTDEMNMMNNHDQLQSLERRPYILTATAQANRDTVSLINFCISNHSAFATNKANGKMFEYSGEF